MKSVKLSGAASLPAAAKPAFHRLIAPAAAACVTSFALLACRTPRAEAPASVTPTTPALAPSYEVHEWGLLRGTAGDRLEAGAIAPRYIEEPMAVDKPVLYVHADAPLTLRRVHVDAHDGVIVESWPNTPRTGVAAQVAWYDVAVTPSVPGVSCEPTRLPGLTDPACTSLPVGDACEVASLASVRTRSAACLRTAGATESLLFYRARTRSFTPPLRFEVVGGTTPRVRVVHVGTEAIPGRLVRLTANFMGISATVLEPPRPGASIELENGIVVGDDRLTQDEDMPAQRGSLGRPPDAAAGREAVRETMLGLGLDDAEVRAFLRAWDLALFGQAPTTDGVAVVDSLTADRRGGRANARPTESFLYFLPATDCERVAAVTFDPPARAVHRALAVWATPLPAR